MSNSSSRSVSAPPVLATALAPWALSSQVKDLSKSGFNRLTSILAEPVKG